MPWHEVFDTALQVAVEDDARGGGEIVDWVHVGYLVGGDDRGHAGLVLGADFVASK